MKPEAIAAAKAAEAGTEKKPEEKKGSLVALRKTTNFTRDKSFIY